MAFVVDGVGLGMRCLMLATAESVFFLAADVLRLKADCWLAEDPVAPALVEDFLADYSAAAVLFSVVTMPDILT